MALESGQGSGCKHCVCTDAVAAECCAADYYSHAGRAGSFVGAPFTGVDRMVFWYSPSLAGGQGRIRVDRF